MRIIVEPPFWELFPEAQVDLVVARGIDNRRGADEAAQFLTEAAQGADAAISDVDLASHPAVAPWRDAYRRFGLKPAKYRSGIENLLRAARSDAGVRSINPLVDLYNAVSLRHLLPCGGEDLASLVGDLRLTRAVGDEYFFSLGGTEPQPPAAGEVIYRDDHGVVCRAWNWREADRTKLTSATTDAVLVIERVPPLDPDRLAEASAELASLVPRVLGGTTRVVTVDRAQPAAELVT